MSSTEPAESYAARIAPLLEIGSGERHHEAGWPDYLAQYGFTDADSGDLIRLACDPALLGAAEASAEAWAPMHAWRALGQLRAEAAVAPLLDYLSSTADADDAATEELPVVFGMIGPAAFPPLAQFLAEGGGRLARPRSSSMPWRRLPSAIRSAATTAWPCWRGCLQRPMIPQRIRSAKVSRSPI